MANTVANSNMLSYQTIINDMMKFRGRTKDLEFSKFDDPGYVYFKPIFYFNNIGDDSGAGFTSNLLGLDDLTDVNDFTNNVPPNNWNTSMGVPAGYSKNTAYNYLMLNDEEERAGFLKQFILLLSEISSNSPWYFTELVGLDGAVDTPFFEKNEIDDTRREINIKCLPDAYDTRIGTLIDLYKAACYSNIYKREIIPANLRKFDMGIYVFSAPYKLIHTKLNKVFKDYDGSDGETIMKGVVRSNDISSSEYFTSCKYIELHNCEFDIKNGKDAYATLSNQNANQLEYNIKIFYDDAMESRYNEFITKTIGDFVILDMMTTYDSKNKTDIIPTTGYLDKLYSVSDLINKQQVVASNTVSYDRIYNPKPVYPNSGPHGGTMDADGKINQEPSLEGLITDDHRGSGYYTNNIDSSDTSVLKKSLNNSVADNHRGSGYYTDSGYIGGILSDLAGTGLSWAENKIVSAYLGNAHGFSLNEAVNSVNSILSGDVFASVSSISNNLPTSSDVKYTNGGTSLGQAHTSTGSRNIG